MQFSIEGLGIPSVFILTFSVLIMQPLQFLVPTFLMAARFPRKDGFKRRCAIALTCIVAFNVIATVLVWLGLLGSLGPWLRYAANFCVYSLYLVVLVPAVRFCFEMGVWDALFCATAGYTIQNLGSGAAELVRLCVEGPARHAIPQMASALLSDLAVIAVIAVCYLVFIRRMRALGSLGEGSRGMLAAAVGVILVVIAFDVVVRGLGQSGAPWGFLIVLRIVHTAVSFFVLFAEYEMLYSTRLKGEIAAREILAEERERQYELSRETIAAVNRRVHDIRHKVVRELSGEDVRLDRDTLKSIVRDISVFDTSVKTGNEVLDTILTEKSLICARRGVTLSCIADGTALARLSAADLYACFSLLIDSAVEAVCGLEDERMRSISLTLRRVGELALLHVEHYSDGSEMLAKDRLAEIAIRYGGTLTVSDRGQTRAIDAMIPVP